MRFSLRILLLLFPLWWGVCGVAAEKNKALEKLMESYYRPTPADLMKVFPEWPEANPFPAGERSGLKELAHLNNMRTTIPRAAKAIAALETIYPGATFVTVGRDTDVFADVLELYFRQRKEPGRLLRLKASTPTIPGSLYYDASRYVTHPRLGFRNAEYKRNLALLRSTGVDVGRPGKVNPIVILDSTSYGDRSQVRSLIQTLYRQYVDRGGNPKDIVRKVNAVNIDGQLYGRDGFNDGNQAVFRRTGFDLERYFTGLEKKTDVQGPAKIIDIDARKLLYFPPWHEEYGPIRVKKNGTAEVRHYGREEEKYRLATLHNMFETIEVVSDPAFMKAVDVEKKFLAKTVRGAPRPGRKGCPASYARLR